MGKTDRDPFSNRYGQKTDETEKGEEVSKTEVTDKTSGESKSPKNSKTPLRERTNINMYIEDEGLIDDLQLRYKKLDLEWQAKHGEDLPKNDIFYPSVLRAALNGTTIREELELE